jgi:uncharacterized membrane protein YfcA
MSAILHDLSGFLYGLVVGISLGLTGGGGSIFAVPLLIYGLGIPVRSAIGLSLAVVGASAGFGAMLWLKARDIDLRSGMVFALGGMVFAPLGTWIGSFLPASLLLSCFAVLMSFVGWRMWVGKAENADSVGPCVLRGDGKAGPGWVGEVGPCRSWEVGPGFQGKPAPAPRPNSGFSLAMYTQWTQVHTVGP